MKNTARSGVLLDDAVKPRQLPNLERVAEYLQDLPRLWLHAGVTNEEREALVRQVFLRITIAGKEFVDIEPKPEYAPLFATMVTAQKVGYQELDSPSSSRPLGHIVQFCDPIVNAQHSNAGRQ